MRVALLAAVASPPPDEQRRYLADVTDGIIGRILDAYAAAAPAQAFPHCAARWI
jgi:hypothetical protein